MKSALLRLTAAFLLTIGSCIGAETTPPAAQSQTAATLRVMSFNIRNSGARDGENHWSKRKDLVVSTIRTFNPDLLGLQEVLADQYDELLGFLPDYAPVGVARDDGARKGEWAAILYRKDRFEISNSGNFWLSDTPEKIASFGWDAACVRICTWAKLRDRNSQRAFLFANTHFDHEGNVARINSARLLRERLPQLAAGSPVILTGDFNCTEVSEPYKILTSPSPATSNGSNGSELIDGFRSVNPVRGETEASFHEFKGSTKGLRIDWILHSKDLKTLSAEIIQKNGTGGYSSDHFPVTAIIE